MLIKIQLLGMFKSPSSNSSNLGQEELFGGAAPGTFSTHPARFRVPSSRHRKLRMFKETVTDFVTQTKNKGFSSEKKGQVF